jgi:hypothetical protein
MRKNLNQTIGVILILLIVKSNALAQSPKTAIKLAPGITTPISYPNNTNPQRMTPCDNADVRIFPSARPQSEIHLSINKQNPQVLLLSANTFPQFNSWQDAYRNKRARRPSPGRRPERKAEGESGNGR